MPVGVVGAVTGVAVVLPVIVLEYEDEPAVLVASTLYQYCVLADKPVMVVLLELTVTVVSAAAESLP